MKKVNFLFLTVIIVLFSANLAGAISYQYDFTPIPADLYDLDHNYYYKWGINWTIPSGQSIVGASLFFDNIRNWDNNPNDLYVHLLDTARVGVRSGLDYQGYGDFFNGKGEFLVHYQNLTTSPHDTTYNFDSNDLNYLTYYLRDNNFGLGIDPDCHYYNCGIKLTINTRNTPVVPEPGVMVLISSLFTGIFISGRKIRNRVKK